MSLFISLPDHFIETRYQWLCVEISKEIDTVKGIIVINVCVLLYLNYLADLKYE